MTGRPTPVPDDHSAPFWSSAAEHVLVIARCQRCAQLSHPPDVVCPRCGHLDPAFAFEPVSGTGTVCSWVVLRQSFLSGFDDVMPLLLVDIAIDEEPDIRLIGRLLDGAEAPVALGDRVRIAFEDLEPGVSVPAFRLDTR